MNLCRCGFLTKWPMVGGVLVPVAVVIAYDAVVFILVMRRLFEESCGKTSNNVRTRGTSSSLPERSGLHRPAGADVGARFSHRHPNTQRRQHWAHIRHHFSSFLTLFKAFSCSSSTAWGIRSPERLGESSSTDIYQPWQQSCTVNTTKTSQSQFNAHSSTDDPSGEV